uniref:Rad17 cell cycle checkpoint protein n=1 Tax=Mimivirus LCMiAC02 TaxID=2506609 RepID=A0A481Z1J6_9VIRU|nr:MAG: Rad17 cell cycle checkpoint protein [Mimivirus LCMiAC02]
MHKSNNTWIDKYRPTSTDGIVCNRDAVKDIKKWLNSYNKFKKSTLKKIRNATKKGKKRKKIKNGNSIINSCMTVTGEHGVGKTMIMNTILNEYGFKIRSMNLDNFKSNININKYVDKIVQSYNIVNAIKNTKSEKMAIVIDNMESISGKKRKIVTQLHKHNNLEWRCPIIFISSNKHVKWINEIKKNSFCVRVKFPCEANLKKILEHIIKSEGIKIANKRVYDIILYHCQSDVRRLINTLFDIYMMCNNKLITVDIINEFIYRSQKKDVELGLFNATNKLLYGYTDIDNCLKIYETDKTQLPLMVQQHYIPNIILNHSKKNGYKKIKKIAQCLSRGDVIKNYIYSSQHWDIYDINGIYTCTQPSYEMHKKNGKYPFRVKLIYAADMNKTSIKNINKKNIVKAKKCFINMNVKDFIFMNMIVKEFIENDDIKGCVKLMKNYHNINVGFIDSLLKIDKINKKALTNKQKKEFIKYFTKYKNR